MSEFNNETITSISNELDKLNTDKENIKNAITSKGVTSTGKFNKFAEEINKIPSGISKDSNFDVIVDSHSFDDSNQRVDFQISYGSSLGSSDTVNGISPLADIYVNLKSKEGYKAGEAEIETSEGKFKTSNSFNSKFISNIKIRQISPATKLLEIDFRNYMSNNHSNNYSQISELEFETKELLGDSTVKASNKSISNLFGNCYQLLSIPLIKVNTSEVEDISSICYYCNSLKKFDFGTMNLKKVTNFNSVFYGCNSITSLSFLSENFDNTKSDTLNLRDLITGCRNLKVLNLTGLNLKSGDTFFSHTGSNEFKYIIINKNCADVLNVEDFYSTITSYGNYPVTVIIDNCTKEEVPSIETKFNKSTLSSYKVTVDYSFNYEITVNEGETTIKSKDTTITGDIPISSGIINITNRLPSSITDNGTKVSLLISGSYKQENDSGQVKTLEFSDVPINISASPLELKLLIVDSEEVAKDIKNHYSNYFINYYNIHKLYNQTHLPDFLKLRGIFVFSHNCSAFFDFYSIYENLERYWDINNSTGEEHLKSDFLVMRSIELNITKLSYTTKIPQSSDVFEMN